MKNLILLTCMLFSVCLIAQESTNELKEIKVSPPQFTGIENVVAFQEKDNRARIRDYIVENMKYIECPSSGEKIELFPKSDDDKGFKGFKYKTIAEFAFIPGIGNKDKNGIPYYLNNREHDTSKEYDKLGDYIING